MPQCPVCYTEYVETKVENCSTCGWDLTPYPPNFRLPDEFVKKEQAKLAWAKEIWSKLLIQQEKSNQELTKLKPENELLQKLQFQRPELQLIFEGIKEEFYFDIITVDSRGKETNRRRSIARQTIEDLGNGVTLEMVYIPFGTFMMGSKGSEKRRNRNENPQHQVTIQSFLMGKYPITQEQYLAVMGKNPSRFQGKKLPVENVSWDDAVEFCARLSDKTGRKYQLPSEAQWEYACRAGTITPFHFGQTITTDLANYDGNYTYGYGKKGIYRKQTTIVGSFPANAFGLYDMHGNVWEWCEDTWHDNYVGAPCDGSSWIDNNFGKWRVMRGGSWISLPGNCRCATRDYISYYAGFRVCRLLRPRVDSSLHFLR